MIKVLDHGYVNLVETWGSDERIIESARMSTDKGFQGWGTGESCYKCQSNPNDSNGLWNRLDDVPPIDPSCKVCLGTGKHVGDERLLAYLYRNKHATPFEMAGLIVEVKAPIFVFREWHRHRTQSYNEMSARYIPIPDENYIPSIERIGMRGGKNKQAQGLKDLDQNHAEYWARSLEIFYDTAQAFYQNGLEIGIPKELARLCIPVGRYSKMRASANLRNWLGFLTLRMDPAAQWEIREYARAVGEIISEKFPRTWELFQEGGANNAD